LFFPEAYKTLTQDQVAARIRTIKEKLGKELIILGHHYMSDAVIQFADYRGDSLELSRKAAQAGEAHYIVFCGVHFMAETAAILSRPGQIVTIPDRRAGCLLADMAEIEEVRRAWDDLYALWGDDLTPITYVNSAAELKAFCGEHGGVICTSSNAAKICRWALQRSNHALFFPDANLGTNTALAMGIPRDQIKVWNPSRPLGGNPDIAQARFVAWRGFCNVHVHFTLEHIAAVRARYEGIKVVVHPECSPEVVAQSDANGSTSFIVQYVRQAPAGARIAIGTESNLVYRLAKESPDKLVVPLVESYCISMERINPYNLLRTLDSLLEGHPMELIEVSPENARWARVALERMLQES